MAVTERSREQAAALLDAWPVPEGEAVWAREAREAARAWLMETGVPGPRDEYWRFTDPASLTALPPPPARTLEPEKVRVFDIFDTIRIVFADGVLRPDLSDDLAGEGLIIERLDEVMANETHWAREFYGQLEAAAQSPVPRPLAALNTAAATAGVVIRVTGRPSRPVLIRYLHESETSDAVIHHVVKLDPGSALTVLENGPAAARFNKCMEISVGDGAEFHHIRAQGRDHERRAVTHLFARLGVGSAMRSFTLTANGRMTRNEAVVELMGEGGTVHVAGACLGDGDFHHDDTVFITHAAEHCESRQVFKKVLRNGAVGVFQGKILVRPGAQKTDGYQLSQGLLLDGDSQF
ncbi:MAG: SufD family Fe-S cluster assembly protein, partial [Alphaproteobacteria bacterium]